MPVPVEEKPVPARDRLVIVALHLPTPALIRSYRAARKNGTDRSREAMALRTLRFAARA